MTVIAAIAQQQTVLERVLAMTNHNWPSDAWVVPVTHRPQADECWSRRSSVKPLTRLLRCASPLRVNALLTISIELRHTRRRIWWHDGTSRRDIVNSCGLVGNDHAAYSWSSRSIVSPSTKVAPARTSPTKWGA